MILGLFDPPTLTVPIGVAGVAGFALLGLVGLVLLIGTMVVPRSQATWMVTAVGTLVLGGAAYRFFRAVAPDSPGNYVLLITVAGIPALAALLLVRLLDAPSWGGGVAGGVVAAAGGRTLDAVAERMAVVPIALGTLIILGALFWFWLKEQ